MVSSHLLRLAEESAKLNDLTDNVNELILDTEKKIFKASPGFAFFGRPLHHEDDRWGGNVVYRIGWCRHADKDEKVRWQLVTVWENQDSADNEPHTLLEHVNVACALTKCSRDLRLLAYEHLTDFVSDLTEEVMRKSKRIEGLCDSSRKSYPQLGLVHE
jgi:hypothetical protein